MADPSNVIISMSIPGWVGQTVAHWPESLADDLGRMSCAIELSRLNIANGGGPFAALVFAGDNCIGAGVNRVIDTGLSIAHAEILALASSQMQSRDRLARPGRPLTLVTTTEPCCQCLGALVWAGVEHLICGATTADAEEVGFDEGPKPTDWQVQLEMRGISVVRGVARERACAVLEQYSRQGGAIYGQIRQQ